MNKQKVRDILCGLSSPQQKRLFAYTRNLSKDKDPKLFDDKMLDYIKEVCRDEEWVERTHLYLDSLGWNQSKYEFDQIKVQAKRFCDANHPYFGWNKNFKMAKEQRAKQFEKLFLKMIRYSGNAEIVEYLPREDTHAGWSFILTGMKKKGEYREELYHSYKTEVEAAKKNGTFNKPILIGTRTQASDPFNEDGSYNNEFKSKSRLVSMVDINQVMAELQFARPIQNAMSGMDWYAGGKSDNIIMGYMRKWDTRFKHWLSIDYSKFDQSISDWLIREAFDVIRAGFKYDANFDEELFTIIREDFINKVLVAGTSDDLIYESHKGVPSGSMFTQIVDSIVNILMIDTYMISKGIVDYSMMIMGDDNIIFSNVEIDREDLSGYLGRNFGIEMSPTKCSHKRWEDDEPQFLSRSWSRFGVYRKPEILLAKLIYPERFRDYRNNKDLTPEMIVQCYKDSFPRGMEKFISHEHMRRSIDIRSRIGDGRWLTGLMRYRLLYAS